MMIRHDLKMCVVHHSDDIPFTTPMLVFMEENVKADMGEMSNLSLDDMYILNTMEIGAFLHIPGNVGLSCTVVRIPNLLGGGIQDYYDS